MGSVFKARWAVCLLAACMAACACLLGGCAAGEASGGVLKVGVRADVVGFSSYNEHTGKFYGAEVDIAEELARRLAMPVRSSRRSRPKAARRCCKEGRWIA